MAGSSELNLKNPSILAISIFMSILNFVLSCVENEKVLQPWPLVGNPEDRFSRDEAQINLCNNVCFILSDFLL